MTAQQIMQGNKYVLSILVADLAEEQVKRGEIEAPYWFVDAWVLAFEAIRKARG